MDAYQAALEAANLFYVTKEGVDVGRIFVCLSSSGAIRYGV
jgi:hypothetical protein